MTASVRAGSLILGIVVCAPVATAAPPSPVPAATAREAAAVHSGMGEGTPVVGELAKGAAVTIDIELDGDDGHWCKVIETGKTAPLGYVHCDALDRRAAERRWRYVGTRGAGARGAGSRAAEADRAAQGRYYRPYSDIKVVMYGASWCPQSRKARDLLNALGVSLTEYDIDREPARQAEAVAKSGQTGIPVVEIEGIQVVGFSEARIRNAVEKRRSAS